MNRRSIIKVIRSPKAKRPQMLVNPLFTGFDL
jgi:hypothetical protein